MSWTRRQFLATTSVTGAGLLAGRGRAAHAQGKSITASHSVSTFVYGQHLVAEQKKFFEEEGLKTPDFIVPGGGAKVVQALAAGQAMFALGRLQPSAQDHREGQGRPHAVRDRHALLLRQHRGAQGAVGPGRQDRSRRSPTRSSSAARPSWPPPPSARARTSTASTSCKGSKAADGKTVNDHVEWVGGGASTTMLGGLKAGKFDAIMAVPEWQSAAEDEGFGTADLRHRRTRRRGIASSAAPSRSRWATCSRRRSRSRPTSCRATSTPAGARSSGSTGPRTRRSSSCCTSRTWTRSRARSCCESVKLLPDDLRLGLPRSRRRTTTRGTKVWVPSALDKPIPYAKAVDM